MTPAELPGLADGQICSRCGEPLIEERAGPLPTGCPCGCRTRPPWIDDPDLHPPPADAPRGGLARGRRPRPRARGARPGHLRPLPGGGTVTGRARPNPKCAALWDPGARECFACGYEPGDGDRDGWPPPGEPPGDGGEASPQESRSMNSAVRWSTVPGSISCPCPNR